MAITAFTSGAIIDATAIGKTVLTASSEGVAADAIGLGSTDSPTFVNGTFTGTVTVDTNGGITGSDYLRLKNTTGTVLYVGVNARIIHDSTGFYPNPDGIGSIGKSGRRFAGFYGVDGSFSGNLNTEVGGSQRVYNLGSDGDTNVEYLETSWDTNVATIGTANSGTGVVRNLQFNRGTQPMMDFSSSSGGSIRIRRPIRAYAAYDVGLSYERFNGGYFHRLDASISVNSVDGNFSGDVVMSGDVDFTGLPTSDPSVSGRLWNDSGTVKISGGTPPPP